ncbi:MAG: DUF3052 domain-containing protein [Planctomycetota bacterium]
MPAGYSGTPLAKKLGIKPGYLAVLVNAPDGFEDELEGLPDDATVKHGLRGSAPIDLAVLFADSKKTLDAKFPKLRERLAEHGGIWIAWPKKSSGMPTDLSDAEVRKFGLDSGLVDNKTCAVTEVWSGLRFVIRLKDRKT